eukprot:gene3016-3767_t
MPADLQHFKQTTYGHHVIMGRKTFESLPGSLPGRKLIILSQQNYHAGTHVVISSLEKAIELARSAAETEVFIAGGETIYRAALDLDLVDKIYLTTIHTTIQGDTHFPTLSTHKWKPIHTASHPVDTQHAYAYDFIELVRERYHD